METDTCRDAETGRGRPPEASSSVWATLDRNRSTPFVHKFRTERHRYIFDVNTSRILRTELVVWDIIEDFGRLSMDELIAKYRHYYSPPHISSACEAITDARKGGLLLATRPSQVEMPYTEAYVRKKLASQRQLLILEATERCNFRCAYCAYNGQHAHRRSHARRDMSVEVAQLAIDDFLAHSQGLKKDPPISFYGGEPLLNFPLIKQCVTHTRRRARGDDVDFSVTTNGFLLSGDVADFLGSEGFSITLSLDGPAQIHDRYRRHKHGSATWEQIMSNLGAFLDRFPEYRTNNKIILNTVVVPPADFTELAGFFETSDSLPERAVHMFLNLSPESLGMLSPGVEGKVGYEAVHQRFMRRLQEGAYASGSRTREDAFLADLFMADYVRFHHRGYSTEDCPCLPDRYGFCLACIPGAQRLFVKTDGTYHPCERVQDRAKYTEIGNVHDGIDIPRAMQLLDDYGKMEAGSCPYCWCLPICRANCFANLQDGERLSEEKRTAECASNRRFTHKLMKNYCTVLEANPRALDFGLRQDRE